MQVGQGLYAVRAAAAGDEQVSGLAGVMALGQLCHFIGQTPTETVAEKPMGFLQVRFERAKGIVDQRRPLVVRHFIKAAAVPRQPEHDQLNVVAQAGSPATELLRVAAVVGKADQASPDVLPRVDDHQPFVVLSVHYVSLGLVTASSLFSTTVVPGPSALFRRPASGRLKKIVVSGVVFKCSNEERAVKTTSDSSDVH